MGDYNAIMEEFLCGKNILRQLLSFAKGRICRLFSTY